MWRLEMTVIYIEFTVCIEQYHCYSNTQEPRANTNMKIQIIFEFELFSLLDNAEAIYVLCFQKYAIVARTNNKIEEEVLFLKVHLLLNQTNPTHVLLGSSTIFS
jgi:hypothetical protein